MRSLGKFVCETEVDGINVLFNTITKKSLPLTTTSRDLEFNYFYQDQWRDAVDSYLFSPANRLSLTFIPTWKCTLRCPHCYVLKQLISNGSEESEVDAQDAYNFIEQVVNDHPLDKLNITFVGGEVGIKAHWCNRMFTALKAASINFDLELRTTTTTNLAFELDTEMISFFSKMDTITVSIDGPEHLHNKQRFSSKYENPFLQTYRNLKKLIDHIGTNAILVQGAIEEEDITQQNIVDYAYMLTSLGISEKHIKLGHKSPTVSKPHVMQAFKQSFKKDNLWPKQCCAYQWAEKMVINPSGEISTDYFDIKLSKIGTIKSTFNEIKKAYKDYIISKMEVLNDPGCKNCPAIGVCWGQCRNSTIMTAGKPSLYCNQSGLIEKMNAKAIEGTLVEKMTLQSPKLQKGLPQG